MSIAKPPPREFEEGGAFVEDDPFVYHAGFGESAPSGLRRTAVLG